MPTESHIGLIGFGQIGQHLAERIEETSGLELTFVCDRRPEAVEKVDANVYVDLANVGEHPADLVIETVTAEVIEEHGARLLSSVDLLTMSTTALADATIKEELQTTAETAGARLHVPHGAILGTDGFQDGRSSLKSVSITTRMSPANR